MATRYYSCEIGAGVPTDVAEGSATAIAELATPTADTFTTADAGGTLLDETEYSYRVTAVNTNGETLAFAAVQETTLATGAGDENTITVKWLEVTGATSYKVYGRTEGDEQYLATVAAPTLEYEDTGAETPSGEPPSINTTNAKPIEYRVVYTTAGVTKAGMLKALDAIRNKIAIATIPAVHTFYGVALGGDMPLDVTVDTSTTSAIYELEIDWAETGCTRLKVLNALAALAGYIARDTFAPA